MKIVYFHKGYWPANAPSSTFITYNAVGFFQNGVIIKVITGRSIKLSVSQILAEHFNINAPLDFKLMTAPKLFNSQILLHFFALIYLLFHDFEFLITRNSSFIPFALILKRLKKVKIFYEAHDFYYDLTIRNDINPSQKARNEKIERKYLKLVDGIICVSKQLKYLYKKYLPQQSIIYATTGTKNVESRSKFMRFHYRLAYFGTFNIEKYPIDILLEAISLIDNSRISLVLAGGKNDAEIEKIQKITDKYKISGRVKILPWLAPKDISTLIQSIDVGCAILENSMLNNISSPLKVLEYISYGLPVIATDNPGISDIIENGSHGYLVHNTAEDWAAAINRMYSGFDQYREMSDNCIVLAQKLRWNNRALQIINYLKKFQ